MKSKKHISIFLLCIAFFFLIPSVIDFQRHKYIFDIIFNLCISITLANSWNLLSGFAGQISFGHAGFFGIGCYTAALLNYYLSMSVWYSYFIGGFSTTIIALLLGLITFKLRGPFFALATLAVTEIAKIAIEGFREFTMGTQGIVIKKNPFLGFESYIEIFYFFALVLALMSIFFSYFIRYSKIGYFFLSIKENENATLAMGINVVKYKLFALFLSGLLAGWAGALSGIHTGFVDPDSAFDMSKTVEPIFLTYIGGIGTVFGPTFSSIILVPIGEILRSKFPTAHLLFYGVILVFFTIFLPKGLFGLFEQIKKKKQ